MNIRITIDNENPFNAGWLAAHLGLPINCLSLEGMAKQSFEEGYAMRWGTRDLAGCHEALLMEAWDIPMPFVRHKIRITKGWTYEANQEG